MKKKKDFDILIKELRDIEYTKDLVIKTQKSEKSLAEKNLDIEFASKLREFKI